MTELKTQLRATFEGWKLPDGRSLNSRFVVVIRLKSIGKKFRLQAMVEPTMQALCDRSGNDSFAESKLDECIAAVEHQFERKVTDWA